MGSELHMRLEVNEILNTSLKPEHYIKIKHEFPEFPSFDDDFDNLLYYLEKDIKCISGTDFSGLVSLLNKIGLDEVAKRIPAAKQVPVPVEKYEALKNAIKEIFNDRKYRREYMGRLKKEIISFYELESEDIEQCSMEEIIEDLEEHRKLSRSRSDIVNFKQVFTTCGCNKVVNYINSLENMTAVEEIPMDTDTTDASVANIPQQHAQPSGNRIRQSVQEQYPGSSEATTGGGDQAGIHTGQTPTTGISPTKGDDSSERPRWQTASTGPSPNAGQQQHQSAQPRQHSYHNQSAQPRQNSQANRQANTHGNMFTSSNVGTNINIGPGTNIQSFSITSGIPGHGNQGQFNYVPGGYGQGPGFYGQAQEHHGQDAYYHTQNVPKPPGYLPNQVLMHICGEVGGNWRMLGLSLGLSWTELERIHSNNRKIEDAIMEMLMKWRDRNPQNQLDKMCQALKAHQNVRLAEELRAMMKNQL